MNTPYDYWRARDADVAAADVGFSNFEVAVIASATFFFVVAPFAFFVS